MRRTTIILYLVITLGLSGMIVWRMGVCNTAEAQVSQGQSRSAAEEGSREDRAGAQAEEATQAEALKEEPTESAAEVTEGGANGDELEKSTEENGNEREEMDGSREDDGQDEARREGRPGSGRRRGPGGRGDEQEEDDGLEALNGTLEVKDFIGRLSGWTGKVVIPHQDVMGQKLTIYSAKKLPRDEFLARVYDALRAKGFIIEQTDGVIFIKPIKDAKLGEVPMVSAEQPLALIENRNQIVQKFFRLENYSPSQLQQIILPLIPEHGYVSADETTRHLVVIDTVSNLLRIEKIIQQLDVPEAEETVTRIFEITSDAPSEIVQLLRLLLSDQGSGRRGGRSGPRREPDRSGSTGPATSVVIGPSESPIVLIPMLNRKWIIAKASAENISKIEEWIEKLDRQEPKAREYTIRRIDFVDDIDDLADRINDMILRMPGREITANVMVQPLENARQIMIVGSEANREMVEKLIDEVDVPTEDMLTEDFEIKYSDPEKIAEYIQQLYTEEMDQRSRYSYYYRRGRDSSERDVVRAIAYPALKKVTVIASAGNMRDIREQIKEWDKPINVDEVTPIIIELENSDPLKMASLLSKLFSESESNVDFFDWIFGGSAGDKKKIVGPLFGQLTFEAVPDTSKIIVISKIPEAYEVIRRLIERLDGQEMAELPMVVTLKYADAEELCDQLNAILNEPGTRATILRRETGLSEYNVGEMGEEGGGGGENNQQGNLREIVPWWNSGQARSTVTGQQEKPVSNIIGKIRFIPVHRSKAILVLAPGEYKDEIKAMIETLDQPAKQVIVKAVIMEVNHNDLTSLGVRLATDPASLGIFNENSVAALGQMFYEETVSSTVTLAGSTNVTLLVDALLKYTNGKILNEPTLRMKDNEEAKFFDGREVPLVEGEIDSEEGTRTIRQVEYRQVGVKLQVRPNITPENAVDLTINLEISQVEDERIDGNIAVGNFNTNTHLIVEDGQTILISGIIFQNETDVERKAPLLGDIPLVGELFKHKESIKTNSELLAFITPYVIDVEGMSEATTDQLERSEKKLNELMDTFVESFGEKM